MPQQHTDLDTAPGQFPPEADLDEIASKLNDLIELDFDAVAAYQAAIERLDDPTSKQQLGEFMGDHKRHTRDLAEWVRKVGGTPATSGDYKKVLTKGKVVVAGLVGDKPILMAMKANEDVTNKAYEKALKRDDLSPQVRSLLEKNLSDERRHRAWIVARIEDL